ncbi:unnamed protein product [Paramecium octaurelia]|uniref:Uncharacterized protein n=1 Tax=Paramecium octaurelia TaxID=43137 RepID=A0A8S1WMD5_PAROT|nr:unnamed protein product [Paramecium octaurelia]
MQKQKFKSKLLIERQNRILHAQLNYIVSNQGYYLKIKNLTMTLIEANNDIEDMQTGKGIEYMVLNLC